MHELFKLGLVLDVSLRKGRIIQVLRDFLVLSHLLGLLVPRLLMLRFIFGRLLGYLLTLVAEIGAWYVVA